MNQVLFKPMGALAICKWRGKGNGWEEMVDGKREEGTEKEEGGETVGGI